MKDQTIARSDGQAGGFRAPRPAERGLGARFTGSAAHRRLVEQARKQDPDRQRARLATDAANRFMTAVAGNFPHFEEATRALYAGNRSQFEDLIRDWPRDIRMNVERLAEPALALHSS